MDGDLSDYGVTTCPAFVKRQSLRLGARTVGHLCRERRTGRTVYVSERDSDKHQYRGEDPWYDLPFDGAAYGLSIDLFGRLAGADVGAVYIVETDTGTVYHFGYRQFVEGSPINFEDEADGRGYEKDRQMVVPVADAVEVWEDAYPGIYAKQPQFR